MTINKCILLFYYKPDKQINEISKLMRPKLDLRWFYPYWYLLQTHRQSHHLLHNSAHPAHCTKATPFGVATRVRRNYSTPETFEKGMEYQDDLINRCYNPRKVQQQFNKVSKSIPRENLLTPKIREREKIWLLISVHVYPILGK